MIIAVIIGLCIWLVIPILLEGRFKKKKQKKALRMACMIIGVVIVLWAALNYILSL